MNEQKEPSVRILSSRPAVVEEQLNELADRYAPIVWNIQPVDGKVCVTVVLLHQREVRKSQLATPVTGPFDLRAR
jgi:hypothetical protein